MAEADLFDVFCFPRPLPGCSISQARQQLVKHFELVEADAERFFNGGVHFERQGVDAFTAKHYQQLFQRIGLESEIATAGSRDRMQPTQPARPLEEKRAARPQVDATLCPKCLTPRGDEEQCPECGIYFAKYEALRARQEADTETPAIDEQTREDLALASKLLGLGSILFAIAFVADDYLSNLFFIGHAGIDIGYLPYIAAALLLAIGSAFLIRTRGYPAPLGLVAITGALGLGVLLLLPDRRSEQSRPLFDRNNLFGVLLIGLGLFWFFGKAGDTRELDALIGPPVAQAEGTNQAGQAAILHEGRNEYPATELDDLATEVEGELQELEAFMERGFALAEQGSLRPDAMERLGETLFGEASRFLVWLQYQRYLYVLAYDEVPEEVSKERFNEIAQQLKDHSAEKVIAIDSVRLAEVYRRWFSLSTNDALAQKSMLLNNPLIDLWQAIQMQRAMSRERELLPIAEAIAQVDPPRIPHTRTETIDDKIVIEFLPGSPFEGEPPLVLAYYAEPYLRYKEVKHYQKLMQLNGDFPNKYLINNFSVYYGTLLK